MSILQSYLKFIRLNSTLYLFSDILPEYLFCNLDHISLRVKHVCTVRSALSHSAAINIDMASFVALRSTVSILSESISSLPRNAASALSCNRPKSSWGPPLNVGSLLSNFSSFIFPLLLDYRKRCYHVRACQEFFPLIVLSISGNVTC